jgi:N-acetylmuramoyl-L-alanine amidase
MRAKLNPWTRRATAVLAGLVLAWPAFAANAQLGVRLGLGASATRVVIDSPAPMSVNPEPGEQNQLVLDVSGGSPDQALSGGGLGLVKAWRLDAGSQGARLSLRLASPARIKSSFQIPPDGTHPGYRYVVDLVEGRAASLTETMAQAPTDRQPITGEASAGEPSMRAPRSRETQSARVRLAARMAAKKVIVIDAGHGGHDPGTQNGGVSEKDVTLAAALHLRNRLLREGYYKVVMTRSDDVFVPLEERVRIARRAGADLFIALHADTAGTNDATRGATVYTLSGHGETRVNEVLDGHEWFSRAAPRSDPAVKGILLDLTQRTTLNRSNAFAQVLVGRLSEKVDVLPRPHRDASYFVLLAPDVPAVLLEMGFLSSPQDKARLTDPARRDAMMDTVAAAIDDYFRGEVQVAAN